METPNDQQIEARKALQVEIDNIVREIATDTLEYLDRQQYRRANVPLRYRAAYNRVEYLMAHTTYSCNAARYGVGADFCLRFSFQFEGDPADHLRKMIQAS